MAENTDKIIESKEIEKNHPMQSKLAIWGFIVSVLGLLGLLGIFSLGILPIIGIILGIISTRKISRSKGKLKGKSFSITSIILGGIGLVLPLWLFIAFIWAIIIR